VANKVTMVFEAVTRQARSEINKLKGDIAETDGATKKLGVGAKGLGSTLSTSIKAGAAIGGAALVAYGVQAFRTGRELETMGAKASAVFDDSLPGIRQWAEGVAGAMGTTQDRLVGAAASFADLLIPMGFTAEQAAGMTKDVLELSGALSAWSSGKYTATEVSEILAKAMLGEREQLKSLGISITEADVQRRLAEKGQKSLTGATLAQAKALATQELILEKSTDAQEAWSDGTFDGIKAQNEAAAAFQETKDNLADLVYDAIAPAIPFVTQLARGAANVSSGFEEWDGQLSETDQNFVNLARSSETLNGALAKLKAEASAGDGFWDRLNPFSDKGNRNLRDNYDELEQRLRDAYAEADKFAALDMGWQQQRDDAETFGDVLAGDVRSGTQRARLELDQYNDELDRNRDIIDDLSAEIYGYEEAQRAVADSYREAFDELAALDEMQREGSASASELAAQGDAVRQAFVDSAKAAYDNAQEFAKQKGAVEGSDQAIGLMIDELKRQQEQYPALRDEIQKYIDKLGQIQATVTTRVRLVGPGGDIFRGGGKDPAVPWTATGGTVTAGIRGVGEQGRELIDVPGNAAIYSAGKTQQIEQMASRMSSSGSTSGAIVINVSTGVGDPVEIGRQIADHLRAFQRSGGRI
jgi:hypothetical protein